MAAAPQLHPESMAMEEYLHTSFRPDCDFVEDYIEERNLGGRSYSLLQAELAFWFRSHQGEWKVRVATEF